MAQVSVLPSFCCAVAEAAFPPSMAKLLEDLKGKKAVLLLPQAHVHYASLSKCTSGVALLSFKWQKGTKFGKMFKLAIKQQF